MNKTILSKYQVASFLNKLGSYRLPAHIDQEVRWFKDMFENLKTDTFGKELSLPFLTEWLDKEIKVLTKQTGDFARKSARMNTFIITSILH